ncbi:MAG TPA: SDR family oxidoreductase [Clostridiales bacterium]|jgi:gluconate 5-dehydrogenase|nr:SDR family oxidoreductase [Clostridiales bacterium]
MKNYFDLTGKIAIVTGASSGLGVQFAKALANQGANVALVARRVDRLNSVKEELEAMGVKAIAVKCDVGVVAEIQAAVKEVVDTFGRVDILVNNAGLGWTGPADSQSDELWETMMRVNVNGVYYFAREVSKYMIPQKYGRIVNIGSIHSTVALKGMPLSAYATTKGAVKMMSRALANEWAPHNITVNTIGPGYFPSEMTSDALGNQDFYNMISASCPMGRPGKDGELDTTLLYFASDASSYTTGQYIAVDGGWLTV